MTKLLIHLCLALSLSLIESSLFSSFHGMIRFTPFVFVVSVYVLQHHSVTNSIAWMILHGIILDLGGLSIYPPVTIAFLVSGIVAIFSANHLFSNRSFYGVLACATLSYGSYLLTELIFLCFGRLISSTNWPLSVFFQDAWRSTVMMILVLAVLFSFARNIRQLLEKGFLIPKSRQTL